MLDFFLKTNSTKFCFPIYDLLVEPDNCEFSGILDSDGEGTSIVFKYQKHYVFYGLDALHFLQFVSKEEGQVAIVFEPSNQFTIKNHFQLFRRGDPTGSGDFNNYETMVCSKDSFRPIYNKKFIMSKKVTRADITSNLPPGVAGILRYSEIFAYGVKVDNELISCVPAPHLYLGGKAPRFAILRGIWTDPRYRNRGFASQALGKICDELFDHLNLENIYLWVERDNAIAQQIYTKMGFICVSSWRGSRCYFK